MGQSPRSLRKEEGLGGLTRYLSWERDALKSHKAHCKDLGRGSESQKRDPHLRAPPHLL